MFSENLVQLRKLHKLTQEDIAEKVGVSRQAVAKWEAGETLPDIDRCMQIADIFGVTLDDLAKHSSDNNYGLAPPPKGKHLFGIVTVGEKGQIVIPAKARRVFFLNSGDELVILGEDGQGLAIMKSDGFLKFADKLRSKYGDK